VVVFRGLPAGSSWLGVVLLQGANLAFAMGQVLYADLKIKSQLADRQLLARMYLGAALLPGVWLLLRGTGPDAGVQTGHWPALLYLGLVPTALGFYFWNRGAARAGAGVLAAANNLKVPLAVLVAWLVFGEQATYGKVILGLTLVVAGLFLARSSREKN
jgi:drug/metabolite transporter (DMT)-like permease